MKNQPISPVRLGFCLLAALGGLVGAIGAQAAPEPDSRSLRQKVLEQPAVKPYGELTPIAPPTLCQTVEQSALLTRSSVMVGEPLLLILNLHASPNAPVGESNEFIASLFFGNDLRAVIFGEAGQVYEYAGQSAQPQRPNSVFRPHPGESVQVPIVMGYDRDSVTGAVFDDPGTYDVQLFLRCRGRKLASRDEDFQTLGRFTVTVREPQGDDLKAMQILSDPEAFQCLHDLVIINTEYVPLIEEVVEGAPRSRIWPFAALALARQYIRPVDGGQPAVEKGRELLNKLIGRYPDHPLSPYAHNELIYASLALGETDEARNVFTGMWTDPTLSASLGDQSRYVTHFIGPAPEDAGQDWMLWQGKGSSAPQ